jgi:baseplate J-like protein
VTGPNGNVPNGAGGPPGDAAAEVIYLEVDDEITSAAARLRGSDGERIALVLPYGSRLATSRINFRLLAREAAARGKRIEIVAADASTRALAGSAGLPVHASVAALEGGEPGGPTPVPDEPLAPAPIADGTETRVLAVPKATRDPIPQVGRPRPPIRTRTALIAAAVVVALLAVGGVGAFVLLPSATIVLTPTAERLGPLDLTVQARTDVTAPDATTLTVPARSFAFDVQAFQTFTTTGVKVTEAKASGNVTFQNCDTGGSVTIPANATVSTQAGVDFRTLAKVTVKRASLFPFACKTGSVAVQAELPGTAGNVPAGAINRIPSGYDPIVLSVTNTQPTAGGVHDETPEVSQQDVDAAMTQLNTALRDDFDRQVREGTGVPAGTTLFDATKLLGTPTPSADPATLLGQAVSQFQLGLSATGTVLGVDPTPVKAVAEARLATQVGDGWVLAPDSTKVDVGDPSVSGDTVSFPVRVTAIRNRVVDRDALLAQVKGLVLAEARGRLDDYGQVQITLWPDWVSTVPNDAGRISFTVEAAAPAPSAAPTGAP